MDRCWICYGTGRVSYQMGAEVECIRCDGTGKEPPKDMPEIKVDKVEEFVSVG